MSSQFRSEDERINDGLKAQIRTLVAKLEKNDSEQIATLWEMGAVLIAVVADEGEKFALAKTRDNYYHSIQIHKGFRTLVEAKAFKGSQTAALRATQKGIAPRKSRTIRFPVAAQQIGKLLDKLWKRLPGCDRAYMPELLESLAAKYERDQCRGNESRHEPRVRPVDSDAVDGALVTTHKA